MEQLLVYMDHLHRWAGKQALADFHSIREPSAAVAVPKCRGMVLIVGRFERDQVSDVEEEPSQPAASYP